MDDDEDNDSEFSDKGLECDICENGKLFPN